VGNLILDREITKANLKGQEYLELNIQALDPENDREPDRISTELLITCGGRGSFIDCYRKHLTVMANLIPLGNKVFPYWNIRMEASFQGVKRKYSPAFPRTKEQRPGRIFIE